MILPGFVLALILQQSTSLALTLHRLPGLSIRTNSTLLGPLSSHNVSSAGHQFDTETIRYDIPYTNRVVKLLVELDEPMPPGCLNVLVVEVLKAANRHIALNGDGPLTGWDNPFDLELEAIETEGCYISIEGEPAQGVSRVTYGILKEVMGAMQKVLVDKEKYFSVDVVIEDQVGTKYGAGRFAPSLA